MDRMYNIITYHPKVKHWNDEILTKRKTKTKHHRNVRPTAAAHTPPRSLSRIFILSCTVTSLQLLFRSLSLLHLRFDPITLSKGNTVNSKTRQNNATQVNRRLETAGCVQFVGRGGEGGTEGWQLGRAVTQAERNKPSWSHKYVPLASQTAAAGRPRIIGFALVPYINARIYFYAYNGIRVGKNSRWREGLL
jgi:hypothetical protein